MIKLLLSFIILFLLNSTSFAFPYDCPDVERADEEEWIFIDCTRDPIDCEERAWLCDFYEYQYIYRGYPCGSRVLNRYACYGR